MLDQSGQDFGQDMTFEAGGSSLSGRLFLPAGPPQAAVVLNGATAVPQRFYRHFARWLARERGMACLTYDYSGFAASAAGHVKTSAATMAHWAMTDQPAARDAMRAALPGVPLRVIGHSLGTMLLPLQRGIADITHVTSVASGLVHLSDHPLPYRALAWLFWHGHAPLAARMMGYLPGRALGLGADLPPGVYWQWRDWCTRHGSYLPDCGSTLPAPDWSRCGAPVDFVTFSDDRMAPPASVWRLAEVYGGDQARHLLKPQDFGLSSIGHLDVFTRRCAAVWPALVPDGG